MNIQKIICAFAISAIMLTSCKPEEKKVEAKEVVSKENTKQIAFNVSGMSCEIGCAKTIESKLAGKEGVLDAKVVFTDSVATVKFDDTKINKAGLIAFIEGVGDGTSYKATEIVAHKACKADCKMACCETKTAVKKMCNMTCCTDKTQAEKEDCKMECCDVKDVKQACATDCNKECCSEKKA